MKTLELTDDEFHFLGSVVGYTFTGDEPRVGTIYRKLAVLNDTPMFHPPNIDLEHSTLSTVYLRAQKTGCVVSFNIPVHHRTKVIEQIKTIIARSHGEFISE